MSEQAGDAGASEATGKQDAFQLELRPARYESVDLTQFRMPGVPDVPATPLYSRGVEKPAWLTEQPFNAVRLGQLDERTLARFRAIADRDELALAMSQTSEEIRERVVPGYRWSHLAGKESEVLRAQMEIQLLLCGLWTELRAQFRCLPSDLL